MKRFIQIFGSLTLPWGIANAAEGAGLHILTLHTGPFSVDVNSDTGNAGYLRCADGKIVQGVTGMSEVGHK